MMKKQYILLCVIIYYAILGPLISWAGNLILIKNLYFDMTEHAGFLPFYKSLLSIPSMFIPLVLSFTIEKGSLKTLSLIISGVYILYRIGTICYFLFLGLDYVNI